MRCDDALKSVNKTTKSTHDDDDDDDVFKVCSFLFFSFLSLLVCFVCGAWPYITIKIHSQCFSIWRKKCGNPSHTPPFVFHAMIPTTTLHQLLTPRKCGDEEF